MRQRFEQWRDSSSRWFWNYSEEVAMPVLAQHSKAALEICKSLGIDPKRCRGLIVDLTCGRPAMIMAEIYAEETELRTIADNVDEFKFVDVPVKSVASYAAEDHQNHKDDLKEARARFEPVFNELFQRFCHENGIDFRETDLVWDGKTPGQETSHAN
jgi:hypothetical protein